MAKQFNSSTQNIKFLFVGCHVAADELGVIFNYECCLIKGETTRNKMKMKKNRRNKVACQKLALCISSLISRHHHRYNYIIESVRRISTVFIFLSALCGVVCVKCDLYSEWVESSWFVCLHLHFSLNACGDFYRSVKKQNYKEFERIIITDSLCLCRIRWCHSFGLLELKQQKTDFRQNASVLFCYLQKCFIYFALQNDSISELLIPLSSFACIKPN